MKPYLYIVAVLLIGGGVGFYIGQRSSRSQQTRLQLPENSIVDRAAIETLLQRQKEAYALHDSLMLLRDCSNSYVEVSGKNGESYGLDRAIIRYHEIFRPGKSVAFNLLSPEITILDKCAIVKTAYSKTSDQYEQEGFKGLVGQGVWLMSHANGRWEISAFAWTENKKE
jgi:hypothetical protein